MADSKSATPQNLYGSCHCGFIKYTLTPPPDFLSNPTATRCNCTICQKAGFTSIRIPSSSFTLLSPASKDMIPDYLSRNKKIHLYFCDKCGVQILREGTYELEGKTHEIFSVNLLTVQQSQSPKEEQTEEEKAFDLSNVKITYWDGLHNNWLGGMKNEPWTGGCI